MLEVVILTRVKYQKWIMWKAFVSAMYHEWKSNVIQFWCSMVTALWHYY